MSSARDENEKRGLSKERPRGLRVPYERYTDIATAPSLGVRVVVIVSGVFVVNIGRERMSGDSGDEGYTNGAPSARLRQVGRHHSTEARHGNSA